jgi:hypothetical protein
MDRYRFLLLTVLLLQPFLASSQTYWKVANEYGDEILLTLDLNREKSSFEAYTRKDALKDLAGVFTYALAKAAGKLKYPEIVFIDGKTWNKNDSLLLNGTFNYFDKQFLFSASILGNHFNGKYTDQKNRSHPLTGVKVADKKPIRNYESIVNTAFVITERSLFNSAWLLTDDWKEFKKRVNELKFKISDDYELAATFFWLGKKLPFSPYEMNKKRPDYPSAGRRNRPGIREVKSGTAFFEANSIPVNQKDMDSIAAIITTKGYKKLILDLRGNNRLTPVGANIIANYLSHKPFCAGVYLTRRWNDSNKTIPRGGDYQKLFRGFTDKDFRPDGLYKDPGRILDIVPGKSTFQGKVYVLADGKSSKVAEMLIYTLKKEKIATIIGQKTAGITYISENLMINDEFDLILPDSDFYTSDGKNLNRIGVEPDIVKSGDETMNYVLGLI